MYKVSPVSHAESAEADRPRRGQCPGADRCGPGGCAHRPLAKFALGDAGRCVPSVSTMPGLIELTRILRGPNSLASDRVMAFTAALVALYTEVVGGRRWRPRN